MKELQFDITPATDQRQTDFLNAKWEDLQRVIWKCLGRFGSPEAKEEATQAILTDLITVIRRFAYVHPGWQEDQDVLAQSITKAGYLTKTYKDKESKRTKDHLPPEFITDKMDTEEGFDLGDAMALAVDPDPLAALQYRQLVAEVEACLETDLDRDVLLHMEGKMRAVDIAHKHSIHQNTVTAKIKALRSKLQERLIWKGLV